MTRILRNENIIFIDMDGVVANFDMAASLHPNSKNKGFRPDLELDFSEFKPIRNAVESVNKLAELGFNIYFASTAPWDNIAAASQKRAWIGKHFPEFKKRLILTHRKDLLIGDILIDDNTWNGASEFQGEHIHFGKSPFNNWDSIIKYIVSANHENKTEAYNR
tara:strand:- start:67063 stop:67551 length:489 start_codon:yes stop_codon:yes gene_type:complete